MAATYTVNLKKYINDELISTTLINDTGVIDLSSVLAGTNYRLEFEVENTSVSENLTFLANPFINGLPLLFTENGDVIQEGDVIGPSQTKTHKLKLYGYPFGVFSGAFEINTDGVVSELNFTIEGVIEQNIIINVTYNHEGNVFQHNDVQAGESHLFTDVLWGQDFHGVIEICNYTPDLLQFQQPAISAGGLIMILDETMPAIPSGGCTTSTFELEQGDGTFTAGGITVYFQDETFNSLSWGYWISINQGVETAIPGVSLTGKPVLCVLSPYDCIKYCLTTSNYIEQKGKYAKATFRVTGGFAVDEVMNVVGQVLKVVDSPNDEEIATGEIIEKRDTILEQYATFKEALFSNYTICTLFHIQERPEDFEIDLIARKVGDEANGITENITNLSLIVNETGQHPVFRPNYRVRGNIMLVDGEINPLEIGGYLDSSLEVIDKLPNISEEKELIEGSIFNENKASVCYNLSEYVKARVSTFKPDHNELIVQLATGFIKEFYLRVTELYGSPNPKTHKTTALPSFIAIDAAYDQNDNNVKLSEFYSADSPNGMIRFLTFMNNKRVCCEDRDWLYTLLINKSTHVLNYEITADITAVDGATGSKVLVSGGIDPNEHKLLVIPIQMNDVGQIPNNEIDELDCGNQYFPFGGGTFIDIAAEEKIIVDIVDGDSGSFEGDIIGMSTKLNGNLTQVAGGESGNGIRFTKTGVNTQRDIIHSSTLVTLDQGFAYKFTGYIKVDPLFNGTEGFSFRLGFTWAGIDILNALWGSDYDVKSEWIAGVDPTDTWVKIETWFIPSQNLSGVLNLYLKGDIAQFDSSAITWIETDTWALERIHSELCSGLCENLMNQSNFGYGTFELGVSFNEFQNTNATVEEIDPITGIRVLQMELGAFATEGKVLSNSPSSVPSLPKGIYRLKGRIKVTNISGDVNGEAIVSVRPIDSVNTTINRSDSWVGGYHEQDEWVEFITDFTTGNNIQQPSIEIYLVGQDSYLHFPNAKVFIEDLIICGGGAVEGPAYQQRRVNKLLSDDFGRYNLIPDPSNYELVQASEIAISVFSQEGAFAAKITTGNSGIQLKWIEEISFDKHGCYDVEMWVRLGEYANAAMTAGLNKVFISLEGSSGMHYTVFEYFDPADAGYVLGDYVKIRTRVYGENWYTDGRLRIEISSNGEDAEWPNNVIHFDRVTVRKLDNDSDKNYSPTIHGLLSTNTGLTEGGMSTSGLNISAVGGLDGEDCLLLDIGTLTTPGLEEEIFFNTALVGVEQNKTFRCRCLIRVIGASADSGETIVKIKGAAIGLGTWTDVKVWNAQDDIWNEWFIIEGKYESSTTATIQIGVYVDGAVGASLNGQQIKFQWLEIINTYPNIMESSPQLLTSSNEGDFQWGNNDLLLNDGALNIATSEVGYNCNQNSASVIVAGLETPETDVVIALIEPNILVSNGSKYLVRARLKITENLLNDDTKIFIRAKGVFLDHICKVHKAIDSRHYSVGEWIVIESILFTTGVDIVDIELMLTGKDGQGFKDKLILVDKIEFGIVADGNETPCDGDDGYCNCIPPEEFIVLPASNCIGLWQETNQNCIQYWHLRDTNNSTDYTNLFGTTYDSGYLLYALGKVNVYNVLILHREVCLCPEGGEFTFSIDVQKPDDWGNSTDIEVTLDVFKSGDPQSTDSGIEILSYTNFDTSSGDSGTIDITFRIGSLVCVEFAILIPWALEVGESLIFKSADLRGPCCEYLPCDETKSVTIGGRQWLSDNSESWTMQPQTYLLTDCCEREESFYFVNKLGVLELIKFQTVKRKNLEVERLEFDSCESCGYRKEQRGRATQSINSNEQWLVQSQWIKKNEIEGYRQFFETIEAFHVSNGERRPIIFTDNGYTIGKIGSKHKIEFTFTFSNDRRTLSS